MINFKKGFTLAEVLITLGIIGVVASMTLPSLFSNYQTNVLTRKKELFVGRLEEAMNQMRFHEKLTGYKSLEEFIEELGQYLKINEICDNDELTSCFPDIVKTATLEKDTEIDLSIGYDIGTAPIRNDLFTNNMGIIFADGVSGIINYKDNCEWLDPYRGGESRSEAGSCLSLVYDLNGLSGRNTAGNDIHTYNAVIDCLYLTDGGTCFNQSAFITSALTYAECEAQKDDLKINACCSVSDCNNTDYWAGAVATCGGIDYLPSMEDIADFATNVYGVTIGSYSAVYDLEIDTEITAIFGLTDSFRIMSNEEYSSTHVAHRYFDKEYTTAGGSSSTQSERDYSTSKYTLCIQ
ncbi:MAG: type II secretion system protein [Candidatus Gastranaerophilales bacterium]